MSTTYRTPVTPQILPDINDPRLNDPVLLCRMPDAPWSDEQIAAGLEETQQVPDPAALTNPDAIALAAHGIEWLARAQRIEDCGDYAQVQHCDQGHPLHTLIHRCQSNYTECCADEHAKKTIKRLAPMIDFFAGFHGSRYVAIELAIPIARERLLIEDTLNKIREDIRQVLGNRLEPNWIMCLGFKGVSLIVRVLMHDLDSKGSSTMPTDAWRQLWSEWKVSVSVGKNPTFRSAFNHLLKALAIESTEDRMQQEVLFTGMQRFRASRFKIHLRVDADTIVEVDSPAEDLCVEDTTHDSPAEPNSNQPKSKSCPSCPICGHPADRFSGMLRVNSRQMMEYLANMRGITLPPAPPG